MVAGGDTFINDMMTRSGFHNVFSEESRYPSISLERLKEVDPEILLLSSEPFPFSQKHIEEYQDILPSAKVVLCDGTYFSWYGSRLGKSPAYFQSLRELLDTF